jgi:tetratricopeptide (TPR) repeat protein
MANKESSFLEDVKTSLSQMPKWKLALLLGTPVVAIGLGAYLMRHPRPDKPPSTPSREKGGSGIAAVKPEPPVAKVAPKPKEVEDLRTPLEKALAVKNKGNKLFKLGKFADAIENYTKAIGGFQDQAGDEFKGTLVSLTSTILCPVGSHLMPDWRRDACPQGTYIKITANYYSFFRSSA